VSDNAMIQIRGISKTYISANGAVKALDPIDLDINESEFVSVVGPSGCGKSTLLMLISGLLRPSTGTTRINDDLVNKPYTNLGFVFQRDVLLEWRNVLENVLLQVEIRHMKRSDYEQRAISLLTGVGLGEFTKRYPNELSGGMAQRVSICRALLHDPPLLLMDEPFGALDAITRDQMNLDLERIWERSRKTVIFITHSVPEAIFLSDRVLVMSKRPGRIVEIIPIELSRPRKLAIRETPEFIQYNRRIREIFRAQGILVEEEQDDEEHTNINQDSSMPMDF
jgi:NitT/TauT family transport system ATP-binding protein